ncbi:MAG: pilus assembly protein, partial [Desulfurivibrionaceae bacterium]
MKRFLGIICCLVAFFGFNSRLFAATAMNGYCQSPPFLTTAVQPNVMLTVDVSGSMSWAAYYSSWTATNITQSYDATKTYEGYFIPAKVYKQDVGGIWTETADTEACSLTYTPYGPYGWGGIYNYWNEVTISGTCSGNKLDFALMHRIDLVRWAMTGGNPASCTGNKTFDKNQCDPELWQQPGNSGKVGSVCNDTIGGCILLADDGVTQVKVPWSRMYDGLAFQFEQMSLKPRLGAMFFSDYGMRSKGKVYIGDFTAPNTTDTAFPYSNLITSMNSSAPGGGTPTGPAMWDTFNYFRQTTPQYGGLAVQSGSGDRWKDPMYVCDGGGVNCSLIPCAKNFTILMSDGQWNTPSCSIDDGISDPVTPAYQMHKGFTNAATNVPTNVNAVYAIGLFLGGTGETSLKNMAMYGAFNTTGRIWPGSLTGYPQNTCAMDDCGSGKGSGCTPLPSTSTTDWDANGDNVPDTFYNASDAAGIKQTIMNAILDILRRASSGTAVSVLSSSKGSGANLMQALFYPKRTFAGNTEVSWTSDLMNYWYYMDPFLKSSQIREDTIREGGNAYTLLDLKQDYITNFVYDSTQGKTMAQRWMDSSGTGTVLTALPSVPIENTIPIWRAGFNLWWTDPTARNIYTSVNGSTLIPFDTTSSSTLASYLGLTTSATANATINYVRGYDCVDATGAACVCGTANCSSVGRSRTVAAGVCSARRSPCNSAADCPSGETCTQETHVWKLGDIISSTPRIMGPGYLDNFNSPAPFGYNDQTYSAFIKSNDYANRQLVFVGSNDGMLHAFKLGKLVQSWKVCSVSNTPCNSTADCTGGSDTCTGSKSWYQVAEQIGPTGVGGMGSESYAFIPKNTLPYLQYLQDMNYCHIYMVDGSIAITDASINKPSTCTLADYWNCPKLTTMQPAPNSGNVDFTNTSWRTTLIGSMGIGGATCDAATPDISRISTPLSVSGNPVGWSSYFALDVTDQTTPQLLWEFGNAGLGVTNVGAAIVKVGGNDKRCTNNNAITCTTALACGTGNCVKTNGRWFAILASGSTGPISNQQFMGTSDQNLKLFVLDLKTGELLRTIDTGITNAFAGSISTSALDLQKDRPGNSGNYQDNA